MPHTDIYITKITVDEGSVKFQQQKLVENGNAHEFYGLLQTGDGAVIELTGNKNNYSPTDWNIKKNFVISASTPLNITGFVAGTDWEEKRIIIAEGSAAITFTNDDNDSSAANRMYCHTDVNIVGSPKDIFIMVYDPTATKWRIK